KPVESLLRPERLLLSYAQQRLWFLAQLEGVSRAYHTSFGWFLKGELDAAALRRALDRVVARHEALRTTFPKVEGEAMQRIGSVATSQFHLVEQDLRNSEHAQIDLERLVDEEVSTPFNLGQGPLIHGRLIRSAEDEHTLLITMHHIVSDGWSIGVLQN